MKLFKKFSLIAILILAFSVLFALTSINAFAAEETETCVEYVEGYYSETEVLPDETCVEDVEGDYSETEALPDETCVDGIESGIDYPVDIETGVETDWGGDFGGIVYPTETETCADDTDYPTETETNAPDYDYEEQMAYIYSENLVISPDDINIGGCVYGVDICTAKAPYSSFQIEIMMPWFVNIVEVIPSKTLESLADTAIFDYNINGKYVYVTFSSPNNFSETDLFRINFTVNDYYEKSEMISCGEYQFVNENVENVEANINLGCITIAKEIVKGDVNGDSIVDLSDLLIIQRSIVNYDYPLDGTQFEAADIDGNGTIDMFDCQYIQNYLVGRLESLEDVMGGLACKHINQHEEVRREPTCTAQGIFCIVCDDCGEILDLWRVDPLEHNYDENGVCTLCGEGEADEYKILYSYSSETLSFSLYANYMADYTEKIYTADGMVEEDSGVCKWYMAEDNSIYVCTRNGEHRFVVYEDGTLAPYEENECPHANIYTETVKATCITYGYERTVCKDCRTVISENETPTIGHSYNEKGTCIYCGEGGEVVAPEAPNECNHANIYTEKAEATCITYGYERTVCKDCKTVISENETPTIGHSYNEKGTCIYCGEGETAEGNAVVYSYNSDNLTLTLYSDYTAEYTEIVYGEDGTVTKDSGMAKWYEADGKIYVIIGEKQYAFVATAAGGLELV